MTRIKSDPSTKSNGNGQPNSGYNNGGDNVCNSGIGANGAETTYPFLYSQESQEWSKLVEILQDIQEYARVQYKSSQTGSEAEWSLNAIQRKYRSPGEMHSAAVNALIGAVNVAVGQAENAWATSCGRFEVAYPFKVGTTTQEWTKFIEILRDSEEYAHIMYATKFNPTFANQKLYSSGILNKYGTPQAMKDAGLKAFDAAINAAVGQASTPRRAGLTGDASGESETTCYPFQYSSVTPAWTEFINALQDLEDYAYIMGMRDKQAADQKLNESGIRQRYQSPEQMQQAAMQAIYKAVSVAQAEAGKAGSRI